MTTLEKIKVYGLKLIGLFMIFGSSFYIIQDYFYKEQPASVKWSFTGIILLILLAYGILKFIKSYKISKTVAHEVAKNMGEPSQSINPVTLEFLNYISLSIPFIILGLINQVLVNYSGSVMKPLMLILSSISIGYVIRMFAAILEQVYIKQHKLKEKEEYQNQIVEKLNKSLK